jgi:superfamily I DNA and RNA helicase
MLQDRNHWEDVGYEVIKGDTRVGTPVIIRRPDKNSPTHLTISPETPLIEVQSLRTHFDEVEYCAAEFDKFIQGGLQPEDLMAIAIDDRSARTYISALSVALSQRGLDSNRIQCDGIAIPPPRPEHDGRRASA